MGIHRTRSLHNSLSEKREAEPDQNQSLESRQSVRVGQYEVSVFACARDWAFVPKFDWEAASLPGTF